MGLENKKINIDDVKVIQAPLAGISDVVFRGLIRKHNSKCLMTTEMISSEMLCNNPNPREVAKEIGTLIEKKYKERFGGYYS